MADCHLLRPEALWLFPVLIFLLGLAARYRSRAGAWRGVCDPVLLPHILQGSEGKAGIWPLLALGLGGTLAILALSGPACEKRQQPVLRAQSALVIILDLSRSMDADDLKPSRLAQARFKLTDILRQRKEGQTALLVFAAQPFVVTPLTDDTATIIAQVQDLNSELPPAQGSRADLAAAKAVELMRQAGVLEGDILLITDGVAENQIQTILDKLKQGDYRLSVLGVGTVQGAPVKLPGGGFLSDSSGAIVIPKLDVRNLQKLALQGGGVYQNIRSDERDVGVLLSVVQNKRFEQSGDTPEKDFNSDEWREEGPWLLLLLLPLAALVFRRGYLIYAPLILLPLSLQPQESYAFDWDSLWLNRNQRAVKLLEEEKAAQAAAQFTDPQWKAQAHYRAGQYDEAAKSLQDINTPDALYNKANALARQGKLEEALADYEKALAQEPEHEDAKYNRDLVKKALEEQQKQQDRPQQGEDSQDKKDSGQNDKEQQQGEKDSQQQNGEQQNSQKQEGEEQENEQQNSAQKDAAEEGKEKEQQAQQEAEQANKENETELAQQQEGEQGDEQQQVAQENEAEARNNEELEKDLATRQRLREIPDDPGGLLRRKFRYQYRQQAEQGNAAEAW